MADVATASDHLAAATPAVPRVVVTTDDVPERERVAFFREELARILLTDIDPLDEGPPRHSIAFTAVGRVGYAVLEGTPSRYVRTRRHLADCDEDFTLALFDQGHETFTQNGRTVVVNTGDAMFINNAMTNDAVIPAGAVVTALRIPGNALRALVRIPENAAGERFDRTLPGVALLRGYLQAFATTRDGLTPELLHAFGLHVVDLVAAILGASRDGAAQAEAGGVRAARLREVLWAIAGRAAEPGFGIDVVGAQLAVTPRYIQRLLEETGATFSEHVLEHRLRKAWRLLSDPACHEKVAAIAYDCGFNDLSNFNRAFRRRFGETPTAVRGAAAAPPPPDNRAAGETDLLAERLAGYAESSASH